MKQLKVLALLHDNLVPPESIEGLTMAEVRPFKMEYDIIVSLEALGHEVITIPVGDDLSVEKRPVANRLVPGSRCGREHLADEVPAD